MKSRWVRSAALWALVLCAQMLQPVKAAPLVGEVVHEKQPDGTMIPVRLWGDEFYQVAESLDGYRLVRDQEKGVTCYARLSVDGRNLVSTGIPLRERRAPQVQLEALGIKPHIRIHPEAAREKAQAARARRFGEGQMATAPPNLQWPTTGNVRGITILVDFPDQEWDANPDCTVTPAEMETYLNSTTTSMWGNNGSVRDYFEDVSNGMLIYTNWVTDYYYRASTNIVGSYPTDLAHECLQHLEDNGFDFSQYDSNQDGYVDAVNIRFAGSSAQNSNLYATCWPTTFETDDGVTVKRFAIVAICGGQSLSAFCHETGHQLCGWPDLYGSQGENVGSYCLMGNAGWSGTNPTQPSAPLKMQAGWMTVTDLVTPQDNIPVTIETNECYRFPHPSDPDELFVLYNRQQVNRDAALPWGGITIWHVDWAQDPKVSLENGSPYRPPDEFSKFTTPDSDWRDGMPSGLYIHGLSAPDTTMTFSFGEPGDLSVSNPAGFATSASEGADAEQTSFTFTLANLGSSSLDWTATVSVGWLDLSVTGGSLGAGETDTLTVTFNEQLWNLLAGVHEAAVEIVDTTHAESRTRRVILTVTPTPLDKDGDGVPDDSDACPGTMPGAEVDAGGCSCDQLDGDDDGVNNCEDDCPETPATETPNADGCCCSQVDCDDGEACTQDSCVGGECLNTAVECPPGQSCDPISGQCEPADSDGDGVADAEDECPGTPPGADVEDDGCRWFSVTLPGGAPPIRAREGEEVIVPAPQPDVGFRFDHWEGDVPAGREHDNPLTLTLDSAKSLIPVYMRVAPASVCGAGAGCTPDAPAVGLTFLGLLGLRFVGPGRSTRGRV